MTVEAVLTPMLVGDITGQFFVPGYQRGYRWGRDEVRRLLDDISRRSGKYYLQPVVVKSHDERWELIDGQQRLSTLLLILRYIRKHLPAASISYSLEYETRPESAAYLEDPVAEKSQENIDFFHMFGAATCIGEWFESTGNPTLAAVDMYQALSKDVHVIWYEAPAEIDSRMLFTRLNVGRIPLTDAELVKATLLAKAERPFEMAAQWDSIERDLRSPEVWSFVTGRADPDATHISLLLDTISGGPTGTARKLFHTFETLRARIENESPDAVWNDIVDLHSLVQGWYDDRDAFHKIGFLVATGSTFSELVHASHGLTRTAFATLLNDRIRQRIAVSRGSLGDLSYEHHYRACERVLLLMNVETVRRRQHSSERYSFAAHAARGWSLEHIAAQSAERLNRADQWSEWLRLHKEALHDLPNLDLSARAALIGEIDAAMGDITEHKFRKLEEEIVAAFSGPDHSTDDAVHSISNLALLAGSDNSALSNACFEVKRREVLQLDRDGSYIPPSTRNVFLKYYTDSEGQQIHFWGPHDRAAYLEAMRETIGPYLASDDNGNP